MVYGNLYKGFIFDIIPKRIECSPVIQKTVVQSQVESYQRLKKMVLYISLLNTRHYKVRIKGKVEQSRERSSFHPYTSVLKLLKRGPSGHPELWLPIFLFFSFHGWTCFVSETDFESYCCKLTKVY